MQKHDGFLKKSFFNVPFPGSPSLSVILNSGRNNSVLFFIFYFLFFLIYFFFFSPTSRRFYFKFQEYDGQNCWGDSDLGLSLQSISMSM